MSTNGQHDPRVVAYRGTPYMIPNPDHGGVPGDTVLTHYRPIDADGQPVAGARHQWSLSASRKAGSLLVGGEQPVNVQLQMSTPENVKLAQVIEISRQHIAKIVNQAEQQIATNFAQAARDAKAAADGQQKALAS